jgi:hypothetical protein
MVNETEVARLNITTGLLLQQLKSANGCKHPSLGFPTQGAIDNP